MMGRLVRDPDIRYSQGQNGELAIANFRLAVDRKYAREDADVKADFFRCTAFGRWAEFAEKYLFKGIKIVVQGRMQNDNYTNRDGDRVLRNILFDAIICIIQQIKSGRSRASLCSA